VAIARALQIPPERVFRKAGLLPPKPDETPTLRELLYLASQLPDEDLDKLLTVARAFNEETRQERRRKRQAEPEAATS